MKVLVTGGSGFVGRHLCRELHERGHEVTAMARNPGKATLPEGVARTMGDVTAYDSIKGAFEGMDAVVNLVALSPLFRPKGGNEMHDKVHRQGTVNCVRAAEEAGVSVFLQMSGIHADPDAPTAYLRSKGRAEEIVKKSDLDWVVVRPTVVFGEGDEFLGFTKKVSPPYLTPLPGGGETRFQSIWIGDLTPILAEAIEDESHYGNVYEIGGAETFTLAKIARLAHGADGRPVNVVPIPMPLAGVGMSLGRFIPGFPFGPDQYQSLKMNLVVEHNDIDKFDVDVSEFKTLTEYLGEQ